MIMARARLRRGNDKRTLLQIARAPRDSSRITLRTDRDRRVNDRRDLDSGHARLLQLRRKVQRLAGACRGASCRIQVRAR